MQYWLFPYQSSNTIKSNSSVRVYVVIISKYATKIVGTQNRQVPCVHGTQDKKQPNFTNLGPRLSQSNKSTINNLEIQPVARQNYKENAINNLVAVFHAVCRSWQRLKSERG